MTILGNQELGMWRSEMGDHREETLSTTKPSKKLVPPKPGSETSRLQDCRLFRTLSEWNLVVEAPARPRISGLFPGLCAVLCSHWQCMHHRSSLDVVVPLIVILAILMVRRWKAAVELACVFHRSCAVLSLFVYASLYGGLFTSLLTTIIVVKYLFMPFAHIQIWLLAFLLLKIFFYNRLLCN